MRGVSGVTVPVAVTGVVMVVTAGAAAVVRPAGRFGRGHVALRVGFEFRPAAGGAEIISLASVLRPMPGCPRIDRHSADGILYRRGRRRRRCASVAVIMTGHGMPVTPLVAHRIAASRLKP